MKKHLNRFAEIIKENRYYECPRCVGTGYNDRLNKCKLCKGEGIVDYKKVK